MTDAARDALDAAIADLQAVGRLTFDVSLRIKAADSRMVALTGLPAEAVEGRHGRDVFALAWKELEPLCNEILAGRDHGLLELDWVVADERPRRWRVSLRPVRDGPSIDGIAMAVADESELALVRDELRHAQKLEALGRLSAGIAHDFNNVLTVVYGYAGLVREDLPEGDASREDLDEVLKAVERGRKLTQRLLRFTRPESGALEATAVDDVLRDIEGLVRRLIGDNVHLHTLLNAGGVVMLHPGELEQIVTNLVVNARDAMPDGGVMTVETADVELTDPLEGGIIGAEPGAFVRVSVADTGAGIEPTVLNRVFEPFFTTKAAGTGTGLGLAMIASTVAEARGELLVTSRVGHGTRFDVYLPKADAPSEVVGEDQAPPGGSERVLVVDQNAGIRATTTRMLEGLGYAVTAVESAKGALDCCASPRTRPDLMLTNVVMPVLSGQALAERCMALAPDLKVLYMSAYSAGVAVEPLLMKPFTQHALALKLREVLDEQI